MLGVTYLGGGDVPIYSPVFLVAGAAAVIAGYFFVRHARLHPSPFIPIRLLRGRGFGVLNTINFLFGAAALGFGALVPLYAEQRYGIPTLQAGTLLTARAIGMICVAALAVLALRRTGYRLPMIVGFLIVATGLTLMFLAPPNGFSPFAWLAVAAGVRPGMGMGASRFPRRTMPGLQTGAERGIRNRRVARNVPAIWRHRIHFGHDRDPGPQQRSGNNAGSPTCCSGSPQSW